jgi:hypothetical protein
MIEMVDKYTLVKGVTYYVKRKKKFLKMLNQYECIFDRYQEDGFVWVLLSTYIPIELDLDLNDFYRYVNREEYYAKVKEKYDATCLNIVLKRLVNDDFRW